MQENTDSSRNADTHAYLHFHSDICAPACTQACTPFYTWQRQLSITRSPRLHTFLHTCRNTRQCTYYGYVSNVYTRARAHARTQEHTSMHVSMHLSMHTSMRVTICMSAQVSHPQTALSALALSLRLQRGRAVTAYMPVWSIPALRSMKTQLRRSCTSTEASPSAF